MLFRSFIESTLAQVYKVPDKTQYHGGPAYYIEKGLKKRWLGIVFAITITFTYGLVFNSVQSNTISLAFAGEFNFDPKYMAVVLVLLTAMVIFGGVKSIANVSQIIIPIVAILYILMAVYVLIMYITSVLSIIFLLFIYTFCFY